jgi:hypothetical protein
MQQLERLKEKALNEESFDLSDFEIGDHKSDMEFGNVKILSKQKVPKSEPGQSN